MNDKNKTPSRSGGALGTILLLLSLLVLVLGVFGAVYLDQTRSHPTPSVARNAAPPAPPAAQPETTAQSNPAAAPAPPAPLTPPATAQSAPAMSAPASTVAPPLPSEAANPPPVPAPPAAQALAPQLDGLSPSAAPANVASAAPRYWVEFGAYDRRFYAERLKNALDGVGIAAVISKASGKGGRTYLRVRMAQETGRDAAEAIAQKASGLKISPLLHRAAAVAIAGNITAAGKPVPASHWVQFGAYRPRPDAERLAASLVRDGIKAEIVVRRDASGHDLFLVRAQNLPDRAAAVTVAAKGQASLGRGVTPLIGEALHARPPPR